MTIVSVNVGGAPASQAGALAHDYLSNYQSYGPTDSRRMFVMFVLTVLGAIWCLDVAKETLRHATNLRKRRS